MEQLNAPPALSLADGISLPNGELVATFSDRKELNRAVDFLASQKFPVQTLYIVGHDVKQVDYITGQATYPRAALSGAVQGIFLGMLVGVFNAFITNTSVLANILSIVPIAMAFSVIYSIFIASRSKGKGIRMRSQMIPARLDLMAVPQTAQAARQLLRVTVVTHGNTAQSSTAQSSSHQPAPAPQNTQRPAQQTQPVPFLPGFDPKDAKPEAPAEPQLPARPVFTPPAETNRDGSKAAGKFGLRIESAEEFERMIREQPEPPTTNERVEAVRAEQSEQRYGLRVDEAEAEKAIRQAPQDRADSPKETEK